MPPGPLWVVSKGSPKSWDAELAAHLRIPLLWLSWWSGCAYANPHPSPSPADIVGISCLAAGPPAQDQVD